MNELNTNAFNDILNPHDIGYIQDDDLDSTDDNETKYLKQSYIGTPIIETKGGKKFGSTPATQMDSI